SHIVAGDNQVGVGDQVGENLHGDAVNPRAARALVAADRRLSHRAAFGPERHNHPAPSHVCLTDCKSYRDLGNYVQAGSAQSPLSGRRAATILRPTTKWRRQRNYALAATTRPGERTAMKSTRVLVVDDHP